MKKRLPKLHILLIGLCFTGLIFCAWIDFGLAGKRETEVTFLDVGQGDASLIQTPEGQNILIDGGENSKILYELSKSLPWWNSVIDLMVLTHPHDDHVGGLNDVLKKYEVKRILYTGVMHNGPAYLAWLELVKEKEIPMTIVDKAQTIILNDECYLEILYPRESLLNQAIENLNNTSIVTKLNCGNKGILFMGDAEVEVEKELLETGENLNSNIIKIGHHGSITSSSEEFLLAVRPDSAIISVGLNNKFNHPSKRIEKRLERLGINYYRTDTQGSINISNNSVLFEK